MIRTSTQNYLCTPGETVSIASHVGSGAALSFFLDGASVAGPSFTFRMGADGDAKRLEATLIGNSGDRAAIRITAVSNDPAGQDIVVLAIGSAAAHDAVRMDFAASKDEGLIAFASAPQAIKKPVRKTAAKAAGRRG